VGQARTQSLQPVHGSRSTRALRLTSTFMMGLAKGVSKSSIASSSQTIIHWSQPMHNSSFTHATASSPPFSFALSSARIAFIIMRMRRCSRARRAARSGISVIRIDAAGSDFSRLRSPPVRFSYSPIKGSRLSLALCVDLPR